MGLVVIVPVVSTLVAALAGCAGLLWRLSGRIQHSEATDLWKESRSIREDLLARNEFLRKIIERLEKRIDDLEGEVVTLRKENIVLTAKNMTLEKVINGNGKHD